MNRTIRNGLLAIILSYSLILSGCTTSWIVKLDTIIAAAGPAVNNVLTIVALAQGKPVNTTLQTKITTDFNNLKILAADYISAQPNLAPTACQQLQAGVTVVNDDAALVLAIVQQAGNSNAGVILAAATALIVTITGFLPTCGTPAATARSEAQVKIEATNVKAMIQTYNMALTRKTGNAAVDAFTKSHKLPLHGRFVHVITLDVVK